MIRFQEATLCQVRKNKLLKKQLLDLCQQHDVFISVLRGALETHDYEAPVLICFKSNIPIGWITTIRQNQNRGISPVAIFVKESHRRRGIGTDLLFRYSKISLEKKILTVAQFDDTMDFFSSVSSKWTENRPFRICTEVTKRNSLISLISKKLASLLG